MMETSKNKDSPARKRVASSKDKDPLMHKTAKKLTPKGKPSPKIKCIPGQAMIKSYLELKSKDRSALFFPNSGTVESIRRQSKTVECNDEPDLKCKTIEAEKLTQYNEVTQLPNSETNNGNL